MLCTLIFVEVFGKNVYLVGTLGRKKIENLLRYLIFICFFSDILSEWFTKNRNTEWKYTMLFSIQTMYFFILNIF